MRPPALRLPQGPSSGVPRVCAPGQLSAGSAHLAPRRAGAHRPGQPRCPTFVRQPLQTEREVPPPAPHPRGRPAARPGLASPARAPAPAPPPPGRAAQRCAGEGRGPRARRAWAAAEGRGYWGGRLGLRSAPEPAAEQRRSPRARAFSGAGGGAAGGGESREGGSSPTRRGLNHLTPAFNLQRSSHTPPLISPTPALHLTS